LTGGEMPETRIDWDRPATGRGRGTCFLCGEPTHAHVQLAVRLRTDGGKVGQMVASKQHGFCRSHAEDVYGRMFTELERG
jgi:hypothetical protein